MELHNTKLINLGETVVSPLFNICLIVIFCFALGGCEPPLLGTPSVFFIVFCKLFVTGDCRIYSFKLHFKLLSSTEKKAENIGLHINIMEI